jgi:molybdate transport system substrate-binding protein
MARVRLPLLVSWMLAVTSAASAETLHVSAAASLAEAFRDIGRAFEKAHPGDTVELNLAGSQVLRTQIEQGAPVDVYAFADLTTADPLVASRAVAPYQVFARNRVVVVVPASGAAVAQLMDLARPGTKVVIAAEAVPVGKYTLQVLSRLSEGYGRDFQTRVQANVVSQEVNVRAVLAKVMLGEADAGFVYATDAKTAAEKVKTIEIAERYNVTADYSIGIVAKSASPQKAKAFVALVLSSGGQAILSRYGFAR